MKLKRLLFRSTSLICILILFSFTFQGIAQTAENALDASQAMLDAQRDAEAANVTV